MPQRSRHPQRVVPRKIALFNQAVTLAKHDTRTAAQLYLQAIELDPYYPEALNNLGILLHSQGNLDAARVCYARALAARPDYTDAEYNYATAESQLGNYEAALLQFSRLLERCPKRADAWNNLGNVFLGLAQPLEALKAFEVAGAVNSALPDLDWNASVAKLLLGRIPEAWPQFERRDLLRRYPMPRWQGENLDGKRLLIHAEQGIGDVIQFSRYCSQVSAGYTIVECHTELIPLLQCVKGVDEFVPFCSDITPPVDYQVPLMSLPGVLGTSLDTIPNDVPYLHADATLVSQWRDRLETPDHTRAVGLVWSGNPKHRNDRNRSIDPSLLGALDGIPRTTFYCLQQKPLSEFAPKAHPLRFAKVLDDLTWPDTAAILANLDLVISVDTAVAHLAGAMARPVWTLLPYAPDWRWMLDRTDSPWYPTMRLFRQPKLGDWQSVIAQVAAELAATK